jgi:hypothetical protein
MRRFLALPALAATGLALSAVALGLGPAQAGGVDPGRALPASESPTEPAQYTIMGDSHVVVMINDLFPGTHANGNEGTLIDGGFLIYGMNGIKLDQVVNGRGLVKAGERATGTTNVNKWRKALSTGPDTIVVNLGTNDGGPRAQDIDKFMRIAGKKRHVFWIAPFYTSCPACRAIHDYELKAAAKRFPNFTIIKVADLGLNLSSDGLHAFGKANSRAIWNRIQDTITSVETVPPQWRAAASSAP